MVIFISETNSYIGEYTTARTTKIIDNKIPNEILLNVCFKTLLLCEFSSLGFSKL